VANEQAKQLAELRQLREQDLLSEAAYQAAVAGIKATYQAEAASGAVAQGEGSTAVAPRGVNIGGNVQGHVITGDNVILEAKEETPAEKLARLRRDYLQKLVSHCNVLSLASLGEDEGTGSEIGLDSVYIALDTFHRIPLAETEKEERRGPDDRALTALEAVTNESRIVLLGDPGGGKSSFVRHLAGWLAAAELGREKPPEGWGTVTPLLLVLRKLATRLVKLDLAGLSEEERRQALREAVLAQWQADFADLRVPDLADHLDGLLASPLLLIFDGLDEVAFQARPLVREAVAAVRQTYGRQSRIIVTCRIRSYMDTAVLPGFATETLAPFDEDKIKRFVRRWYGAQTDRLTPQEIEQKSSDLIQAATDNLLELAQNPMLLTTMAIIHQREVGLPRERVRLYDLAVDVLIRRWQTGKGIAVSPRLTTLLDDDLHLRRILDRLGYEAHHLQGEQGAEADLSRLDILGLLEGEAYLGDIGLAAEFLDYVDQRAGLLIGQGGDDSGGKPQTYGFPHRTFQEYLAGCYLVTGRTYIRRYWDRVAEGDYWYLAAQLGSEELLYNNRQGSELFLDLAYALCPAREPQQEKEWRALVWSGRMAALLPPASIQADEKPGGGAAYLERLTPRLVQVVNRSVLSPQERAEAGVVLSQLGDPRPGVCTLEPEIIHIPAGDFLMGKEKTPISLDAFGIARYPVTNAQFQMFVADGGYTDKWRHCWTDEGWAAKGDRSGPYDLGERFTQLNQPVMGVTWYETVAYANWLRETTGTPYRLPTEAEWERAARHTDGRLYPWGGQWREAAANSRELELNRPTAVGLFPNGAAECGAQDMSGNVWEWCSTRWRDEEDQEYPLPYRDDDGRENLAGVNNVVRVLRGGSYFDDKSSLRCSSRIGSSPDIRLGGIGFRVAVSLFSSPPSGR